MRLLPRVLALPALLGLASCEGGGVPPPPPSPRPVEAAPSTPLPAPPPTPFPGNASCGACPALPCTRECLPALDEHGPALRPPPAKSCPPLLPGANRAFGSNRRDFHLHVPSTTRGPFGLVFLFSPGGEPEGFAFLATAFDADGYILVIPGGGRRHPLFWAMDGAGADADLRFFDEVVACVGEQFPLDRRRIHAAGFSAGGVFSAYLMAHRSDTLASFVAWSTGETDSAGRKIVPRPPRPVPGLLYHGGALDQPDWAGQKGTLALAAHMAREGALAIVCDHGLGHFVPGPFEETLRQMWSFMLAHPFGPEAAWKTGGLTDRLPDYCRVVGP